MGLLDGLDEVWKARGITTGLSSGEGLIWNVRDPVEAMEPVKEKGKVVGYQQVTRDGGVSDKRLLVSESELAQALQVMRREGNTLSPVLRQAWDRGTLKTMTKNNSAVATDAHVSILGSITETELKKLLDENNLLNGFANRFLWLLVKRSKQLPDGGRQLDLSGLRKTLADAFEKARMAGRLERSPACRDLWHALYPELTQERPGLYGAVVARAEAQTLRLSMLYALLEGSAVIDVPHLRAAHAVWRYCDDSARRIFGQRTQEAEDALPTLLLQVMRQSPGVNRKGMYKALGGHVKAADVVAALAKLRAQGKAECRTVPTGGRHGECWWATEGANERAKALPSAPTADACEQPSEVLVEGRTADSSFARTQEGATPGPEAGDSSFARTLTLKELCDAVTAIGGRIKRGGDMRLFVDGPGEAVSPAMLAALQAYQEELGALLPEERAVAPPSEPPGDDDLITEAEFLKTLEEGLQPPSW